MEVFADRQRAIEGGQRLVVLRLLPGNRRVAHEQPGRHQPVSTTLGDGDPCKERVGRLVQTADATQVECLIAERALDVGRQRFGMCIEKRAAALVGIDRGEAIDNLRRCAGLIRP